ncbi:phosphonate ABC transporter ATP-binding protein [Halorubrum vacuolatum]|uniref:Molybdate/tungstate import ATP-binding protein WtpC n=1 Tax=Halorubrum vacuolatum TaxID=63740 RepID=A0A238VYY4_HALVU|nr:ATP-binding cassette domain-containing protein [Halorubrum vacuolatum]SNR39540.1 phosphonate transport system ATP-binding protein [Halorubrum vacuolatum]
MSRTEPPIRCQDLAVGYDGEPILTDLSFTVESGSTLALVGRSGCGKTTLLKTLAGALTPLEGDAAVLDTELPETPPPGTMGYVPQSLGLVGHETVLMNVLHGRLSDLGWMDSLLGRFSGDAKIDACEAIEQVGLGGYERTRVKELSGGQRRRVAIARAFVQEPRVLLADEMLSELDDETARSIVDCLAALQRETDMAVVIVEHNLEIAREIADAVLRLGSGGIEERMTPAGTPTPDSTLAGDRTDP